MCVFNECVCVRYVCVFFVCACVLVCVRVWMCVCTWEFVCFQKLNKDDMSVRENKTKRSKDTKETIEGGSRKTEADHPGPISTSSMSTGFP